MNKLVEKAVLDIVDENPSISSCKLIMEVMKYINNIDQELLEEVVPEIFDELIKENALVAVEYTTSRQPYRTKSLYFRGDTTVNIINSYYF